MIAVGIYIVGMAVILYLRPAFMFYAQTGVWKEFGLSSGKTIFPLWMFAIVWAVVSFALANFTNIFVSSVAMQGMPEEVLQKNMNSIIKPISKSPPPAPPAAPAAPVAAASAAPAPGYYVLETPATGPPKYVYFGTAPPTLENLAHP